MVGDDLEGALTVQVEGGEDGQETLRDEQEEYRQEEVRRTASVGCRIDYQKRGSDPSQTNSSGHQTESTGEESQQVSA